MPDDIDTNKLRRAQRTAVQNCPILRINIVFHEQRSPLQVVSEVELIWRVCNMHTNGEANAPGITHSTPLSAFRVVDHEIASESFEETIHHTIFNGWKMGLVWGQVQSVNLSRRTAK